MIGRRGFLKAIGVCVLGMALALKAPERKKPIQTVSERFITSYDLNAHQFVNRMDVLYGYGVVRPDWPIRIEGA